VKWVAVALGVVVAAFGMAGVAWSRASARVRRDLLGGSVPPARAATDSRPPPVARYLARSVPADSDLVGVAVFEQEGEFRTGEGDEGWRPFTAEQTVRAYPPAFLWDARISMAPFTTVRVRDQYRDGRGGMTAKIGGLITVMDAPPSPELARAALERYLAEAPWVPTRLLPGNGLTWSPVDDSTAVARLTDGGITVSATMSFDVDGDIVQVFVPDRGREVDGLFVPTPWVGRFRDHGTVAGGFRIPRQGEVAWVIDGERVPYWRGRVTSVGYSGSR
jgi:hypothetical protein